MDMRRYFAPLLALALALALLLPGCAGTSSQRSGPPRTAEATGDGAREAQSSAPALAPDRPKLVDVADARSATVMVYLIARTWSPRAGWPPVTCRRCCGRSWGTGSIW